MKRKLLKLLGMVFALVLTCAALLSPTVEPAFAVPSECAPVICTVQGEQGICCLIGESSMSCDPCGAFSPE